MESAIKEYIWNKWEYSETVRQEDLLETVDQEDLESVGKEDSTPPEPPAQPRISQQNIGTPSFYVRTRSQEREKSKDFAVRRPTKGYQQQVGDVGSTRKIGDREVKGGGAEK